MWYNMNSIIVFYEVHMIKIGSLFSGIGGLDLGLERSLNGHVIWQVEENEFCRKVLSKNWPEAIIHDDVKKVGSHNLEVPDLICGGFPCQDVSISNSNRSGIYDNERSSLWWQMHRIINEVRPRLAVMENVTGLLSLGIDGVLGSLAAIGYDSEWVCLSAGSIGAPHQRDRIFIVAYSNSFTKPKTDPALDSIRSKRNTWKNNSWSNRRANGNNKRRYKNSYWETTRTPSRVHRMDDGIPDRMERLKSLGNAVVPQVAEYIGLCIKESGLLDDAKE
jgi:DNA (cytosine-5)-methyltransferase 1